MLDDTEVLPLEGIEDEAVVDPNFYENLADNLSEADEEELVTQVMESFEADWASAQEWRDQIKDNLDLLGTSMDQERDEVPFEGACTVINPLIMETAVKHQSRIVLDMMPATGPAKIVFRDGSKKTELLAIANKVQRDLNHRLMNQWTEYAADFEKMVIQVAIAGKGIRKVWPDMREGRPVVEMVPVDRFVISNNATDLQRCRRYSQIHQMDSWEFAERMDKGEYSEIEGFDPEEDSSEDSALSAQSIFSDTLGRFFGKEPDVDKKVYLVEQHTYLCLSKTIDDKVKNRKLALPYVVVVDPDRRKVVSLRRNWKPEDKNRKKITWFVDYTFIPGFGFYGLGLLHLLSAHTRCLTAISRSLIDAGSFANMRGGYVDKRLRLKQNQGPLSPGEFRDVENLSADKSLDDMFKMVDFKEPSQVLFALYQYLEGRAQKYADATESVVSGSSNYGPVGTTMQLIEAAGKMYTAITLRHHRSLARELELVVFALKTFFEDEIIDILNSNEFLDIVPVSDPNYSGQAHKLSVIQAKMSYVAQLPPGSINIREMSRQAFAALGEENLDELFPKPEEAQPLDPLSDITALVNGKPIKAFEGQDHKSHIKFKQTFLQDPGGANNDMMKGFMPQIQANIREHLMMQYMLDMQGVASKVKEATLEDAAQLVLQANRAHAEEEKGQDPMVKMAQAAMVEAQAAQQKVESDNIIKLLELNTKNKELDIRSALAQDKIRDTRNKADLQRAALGIDAVEAAQKAALSEMKLDVEKLNADKNKERSGGGSDKQAPKSTKPGN